jgi:hypothetical protein
MSSSPSLDMARCKIEGCEWSTLTSTGVHDELREHLQDEHDYTDEEWREARSELMRAKRGESDGDA